MISRRLSCQNHPESQRAFFQAHDGLVVVGSGETSQLEGCGVQGFLEGDLVHHGLHAGHFCFQGLTAVLEKFKTLLKGRISLTEPFDVLADFLNLEAGILEAFKRPRITFRQ